MLLTERVLELFDACETESFGLEFPEGLDLSDLWGPESNRVAFWEEILDYEVVRKNLGWAISSGILPARIPYRQMSNKQWAGSDFRHAILGPGANLAGTRLTDSTMNDVRMPHSLLLGTDLSHTVLSHSNLRNSRMDNDTGIYRSIMARTDFAGGKLTGARFSNSNLHEASFMNADLAGAGFYQCDLRGVVFAGANLTGVLFDNCRLHWARFSSALGIDSCRFQSDIGNTIGLPERYYE